MHAAEPFPPLYVPFEQGLQGPPSAPVYPLLQMHFDMMLLPTGECELLAHTTHADDPFSSLYLPALHAVQLPPSGPE